jgi:5-oxopent-3-ene-1,2,5-tricarboxylate decarboxylase / 2-hydroxyhepta-2,4-diene-1,7-dioate isomerase
MTMIAGTVYGVALNDREQRAHLAAAFEKPPHNKPPQRPVLYIKPRNCLIGDRGAIAIPADLASVEAAPTLALLIGRDAARVTSRSALDHVAGACLALDVSEPDAGFFRPPVRQRCRDGFLRLGNFADFDAALLDGVLETHINQVPAHAWSLQRLLRDAASLISDITSFMTLAAGDLLLVGTPHDAPQVTDGDHVILTAHGLPSLSARLCREDVP